MGIVVAAALHGGAAVVVLGALSLIGWLAVGRGPSTAASIPASLAVGSLLFGWTAFLLGTFIGTWTILPLFVVATLLSLVRVRPWARHVARCARREERGHDEQRKDRPC